MYCPNCGVETIDGANFCPNCGLKLARQAPPAGETTQPPTQDVRPPDGETAQPVTRDVGPPDGETAQPVTRDVGPPAEGSPQASVKPAPAGSKLDAGGWTRVVMSLGMLGLLFIAFTHFNVPTVSNVTSLTTRFYGYGAEKPVFGIIFGGGMIALGFLFKERIKGLLADTDITLIGGGIALAAILMLIPGGMGDIGWFIFEVLIGVILGGVGLVLLKISSLFAQNKFEVVVFKVIAFALLVFAAFTILSGVGVLLSIGILSYDLPNIFLIISSIAGLLGVLGFTGSTVLRVLGVEPGR